MKQHHNIGKRTTNLLTFIALALIIMQGADAYGIAPSRKTVNYANEDITVTATIINEQAKEIRLLVVPQGELAIATTLATNSIMLKQTDAQKEFTYTIKLTSTKLVPGSNMFKMAFIEVPSEDTDAIVTQDGEVITLDDKTKSGITATTAIVQQVIVNVPFPDMYVDGKLYIEGQNIKEPVIFAISLFNRGSKDATVNGYVLVKGPTNEEIAHITLGETKIIPTQEGRLAGTWTPDNTGFYLAEAYITYGDKTIIYKEQFTIGSAYLSIDALRVGAFRLGTIAKFDVELSSKWNKMISDIEGEMIILNTKGGVVSSFETTRKDLPPYGSGTITGYWDTAGVSVGEYDVNVKVTAEGKTSQKTFPTVVSIDSIEVKEGQSAIGQVIGTKKGGSTTSILIILVVVLIILNIGILLFFKKMKGMMRKPPASPPAQATKPAPTPSNTMQQPRPPPPTTPPKQAPTTPISTTSRSTIPPPSETMVNQ